MGNSGPKLDSKPLGIVTLRSFDEGVVETLGGRVIANKNRVGYYLVLDGVEGPAGEPGIPIVFSYPEDVFSEWKLPFILIRREDLSPAMQRWHPGTLHYRAPARGALQQAVAIPGKGTVYGYDRVEEYQQSVPFDFNYSIELKGRSRGGPGPLNPLINHVLRTFQPYTSVWVKDSLGEIRTYDAFMEGTSVIDDSFEIADRVLGFSVTLRIEGELDLNDPETAKTVGALPTIRSGKL